MRERGGISKIRFDLTRHGGKVCHLLLLLGRGLRQAQLLAKYRRRLLGNMEVQRNHGKLVKYQFT